jgi:hypothetical protein
MSQLVVDSSVVVKWFVVEPHSTEARRIPMSHHRVALKRYYGQPDAA